METLHRRENQLITKAEDWIDGKAFKKLENLKRLEKNGNFAAVITRACWKQKKNFPDEPNFDEQLFPFDFKVWTSRKQKSCK